MKLKIPDNTEYQIDFSKVNTIPDIKCILEALDITFNKDYKNFGLIQDMVKVK